MKAKDIKPDTVFLVAPGRSVLTAKRGMAHAGGKITLADINTEKPAETMADFLAKGRVVADKEALEAAQIAADGKAALLKKQAAEGQKRAAAADKVAADKVAADKVAADKVAADKVAADKVAADKVAAEPATEAEIIEAIGVLDRDNTEHWTVGGAPQVAAIETLIGKQISAADRDAAWLAMQAIG